MKLTEKLKKRIDEKFEEISPEEVFDFLKEYEDSMYDSAEFEFEINNNNANWEDCNWIEKEE